MELEKLELENNKVDLLNESITACSRLTSLKISAFKNYLKDLKSVETIILNYLSDEDDILLLEDSKNLRELFISTYNMKEEASHLFEVNWLKNLGIDFGGSEVKLKTIKNTNLEYLSIRGAKLTDFPKLKTPNLRYMNFFSYNEAAEIQIPSTFLKFEYFEYLNICGDGIKSLDFDFSPP